MDGKFKVRDVNDTTVLKAEVAALKESVTVQAAEIAALKAELQKAYGCGARTCKSSGCYALARLEIGFLSTQAGSLLDDPTCKEELAAKIRKMGDIARYGCDSGHY